jgi:hypothetical protein
VAIIALLLYLVGRYKGKFSIRYHSLLLSLLFVYITGTFLALLRGISLNNPSEFIYSDLFRSMVFPFSLTFAGLIARVRGIRYIEKIFLFFILIFITGILIYRFTGFALLGDIVKTSTVQLYNLSFIGFFGFYLLANRHYKNIGRFIILSSWGIALLSLAKWNFFPVVVFPLLWIFIETKWMNTKKRVILCIIAIAVLASVLFNFRDNIVRITYSARYNPRMSFEARHNTWQSYWHTRVVAGHLLEGGHVRSGSRYIIWGDLFRQLSESPFLGRGFGARPTFEDVEDHNMYIFLLIRFGIPLFCIAAILSLALIIHMVRCQAIGGTNRLILFALFAYFFFSAAVGSSFGQMLNGLTVGGIAGIILNPRGAYLTAKEKR